MSKSKNNAIFIRDSRNEITKKINKAYSGGAKTIEEHRKIGGNVKEDVSLFYLTHMFLDEKKSKKITEDYQKGKLLSGEIKKMLIDEVLKFTEKFQSRLKHISKEQLEKTLLKNSD